MSIVRRQLDPDRALRFARYNMLRGRSPACPTTAGRFWSHVEQMPNGCWEWTGARTYGYGRFSLDGHLLQAHRVAYIWLIGPIPADLVPDHLCRNRGCVNPSHLELVTQRENTLRGESPAARAFRSKTCINGHVGQRRDGKCLPCHRMHQARYLARKAAA